MRACVVCSHRDLDAIEAARAAGEDRRAVARRFVVEEASLRRHERAHAPRVTPTPARPSGTAPVSQGGAQTPKLPKGVRTRSAAEAFAASSKAPPQLRSLESILEFLENEAATARSDMARLKAASLLADLLPPPVPEEDLKEPTPADARRRCIELFGDAVSNEEAPHAGSR